MRTTQNSDVCSAPQKFQDDYTAQDVAKLDTFMQLFVQHEGIEMIGVGASKRTESEWSEGLDRVCYIFEGDWKYWCDVKLNVEWTMTTIREEVT